MNITYIVSRCDASRVSPFYCGTQSIDWEGCNCHRCVKGLTAEQDAAGAWPTCEIQAAITYASIDDGEVDEDIARRMGYLENQDKYVWQCGEVEWTEAWKVEYRRFHPAVPE